MKAELRLLNAVRIQRAARWLRATEKLRWFDSHSDSSPPLALREHLSAARSLAPHGPHDKAGGLATSGQDNGGGSPFGGWWPWHSTGGGWRAVTPSSASSQHRKFWEAVEMEEGHARGRSHSSLSLPALRRTLAWRKAHNDLLDTVSSMLLQSIAFLTGWAWFDAAKASSFPGLPLTSVHTLTSPSMAPGRVSRVRREPRRHGRAGRLHDRRVHCLPRPPR